MSLVDNENVELDKVAIDKNKKDLLTCRLSSIESTNPCVIQHLERRKVLGVDENCCTYYIKRKKRCCSNRTSSTFSKVCSMHTPEALEAAKIQDEISRHRHKQKIEMEHNNEVENSIACNTESSKKRTRVSAPKRMINPFSKDVSPHVDMSNINTFYCNDYSKLPMHIDIGCARGNCMSILASKSYRNGTDTIGCDWNHLGIEIRKDLIDNAMDMYVTQGNPAKRSNLYYVACNFVHSLESVMSPLQVLNDEGIARKPILLSFQFPDPWRRGKHLKRLIIQPELVQQLSNYLPNSNMQEGENSAPVAIYLSSDCEDVATHMRNTFMEHGSNSFRLLTDFNEYSEKLVPTGMFTLPIASENDSNLSSSDSEYVLKDGWLSFNPLGVPSERELLCEIDWRRVWRCIFIRK